MIGRSRSSRFLPRRWLLSMSTVLSGGVISILMLITSRIILSVSSFGPASGIPENSRFDGLVYCSFLSACSSSALTLSSSAVTFASLAFSYSMSCSIRELWRSSLSARGCGYNAVFNFRSTRSSFSSSINLTARASSSPAMSVSVQLLFFCFGPIVITVRCHALMVLLRFGDSDFSDWFDSRVATNLKMELHLYYTHI